MMADGSEDKAHAKAVMLGGHHVFICSLHLAVSGDNAQAVASAQKNLRAIDARLRRQRWRSVQRWTLCCAARKDPADEGRYQLDVFLVIERIAAGRTDNIFATWRSLVATLSQKQLPELADVPRGMWSDAAGGLVKALLDTVAQKMSYRSAVEAVLQKTGGAYRALSDELRVPRAPESQNAAPQEELRARVAQARA